MYVDRILKKRKKLFKDIFPTFKLTTLYSMSKYTIYGENIWKKPRSVPTVYKRQRTSTQHQPTKVASTNVQNVTNLIYAES